MIVDAFCFFGNIVVSCDFIGETKSAIKPGSQPYLLKAVFLIVCYKSKVFA